MHPAILEARLRRRGPGGRAAVATLLRVVAAGGLTLKWDSGDLSLHLVPGITTPSKPRSHGPYVEREHVEGLDHIDRKLLELLLDRVACGTSLTLDRLGSWALAHPQEYWDALGEWRALSSERAAGQLTGPEAADLRRTVANALADDGIAPEAWADAAARAYVLGMDRELYESASRRVSTHIPASGASAVVRLCAEGRLPRTVLAQLRRLFSPWKPPRDFSRAHSRFLLPFWYRIRVIDDGTQRLGG